MPRPQVDLKYFFFFALMFRFVFLDISWYSYAAFMISAYQLALIFIAVNQYIPIRYLSGFLMCLQMLIGPALAYNGMDEYQYGYYRMQIPEEDYFFYVIPAVLFFLAGLHLFTKGLEGEKPDVEQIKRYVSANPTLPYYFIGIGFVSSFVAGFFGAELAFVFLVVSGLKFVGLFLIILGTRDIRPLPLIVVFGSIIGSSIAQGMFFDLLTWLIFLGTVYSIKLKPNSRIKAVVAIAFGILAFVIQQIKSDYREATWQQGQDTGIDAVQKALEKKEKKTGVFSAESVGASNLRINQGYIITNIMKTVPEKVPYENGAELIQILEAAFLPRILAPNKLMAGDRFIFIKYTGIPVASGTSMGLSSVGDAYINFGVIGGWFFMLGLGLLFNFILKFFHRQSAQYPAIILMACVVFYYPIRADCELQTILGHLIKSTFIILVILSVWKHHFYFQKSKFSLQ